MMLPNLTRRRRAALLLLSLVISAVILIKIPLVAKNESIQLAEEPCIKHLKNFKKRSFAWPSFVPFLWKNGDDVIDSVLKLREFEKCVLQKDVLKPDVVNEIQEKLFPYLNFEAAKNDETNFWPTWTRWDRKVYRASIPHFSLLDNSFTHVEEVEYNKMTSFWTNWYTSMMQANSKGITISISDRQTADTIRLIHVLRHLKNSLPIQLVHKGDLSSDRVDALFAAAREAPSDESPPQELWLLDVANLLEPAHVDQFKRFINKWLALLFCSFEKPILLDADTVPFSQLEQYYDSDQFKKFGTVFFKDRRLTGLQLNRGQRRTMKRIINKLLAADKQFPTISNTESFYGVEDPIAREILHDLLENRYKHFMESGLVVYDKRKHLLGLLTALNLQFSSLKEYFHGDKEWFWFSQLVRGVPYSFHPVDASSVGKLEAKGKDTYRVCSIQLSHTDVDGSLLWLNGGLRTCKFDTWDWEYEHRKSLESVFKGPDDLRTFYQSPVKLEAAIIPEVKEVPWAITDVCMRYYYCSYYKASRPGRLIEFGDAAKEKYQKIVETWSE